MNRSPILHRPSTSHLVLLRTRYIVPALLLASCAEEAGGPAFKPEFHSRFYLAAENAAAPGDVVNPHLPAGHRSPVDRYLVPEFLCVRLEGASWLDMPEKAEYPGKPTYFDVVYPASGVADPAKPLLLHLHGSGLEFMESVAITALKKYPSVAEAIGIKQGSSFIDVEQTTQEWSKQTLESSEKQPFLAVALERGYTTIFPANCWGDIGHGEGAVAAGFYTAPRYGSLMDMETWKWAKENIPHKAESEIDLSCSGGGHRTAEMLIRDPNAFDAVVVDSPADYLLGFLEPPLPTLIGLASGVLGKDYDDLIQNWFQAFFGGPEKAARWSLGVRMGEVPVQIPFFLAYSEFDDFTTLPVTRRLAEALADPSRYPVERGKVWNTGEKRHCQINTRDRAAEALNWLESSVGFR